MRRGYVFMALAGAGFALAGCTYSGTDFDYATLDPKAEKSLEFATRTVAQLKRLAIGQTREEVMERMRAEPVEGCGEWGWGSVKFFSFRKGSPRCVKTELIQSPYRTASFESDGVRYEALFYYVGGTVPEDGITDQQLTPVLLGNDRLVGWGWDHPLVRQLGPRFSSARAAAALKEATADAMAVAKTAPPEVPPAAPAVTAFEDVYFDGGKSKLTDQAKKTLADHADFLKQNPALAITIEGYADDRGSAEYNLSLGEKRAEEVRRFLADSGVTNALTVIGYGKDRPVCMERTETCYTKNRRVHLSAGN